MNRLVVFAEKSRRLQIHLHSFDHHSFIIHRHRSKSIIQCPSVLNLNRLMFSKLNDVATTLLPSTLTTTTTTTTFNKAIKQNFSFFICSSYSAFKIFDDSSLPFTIQTQHCGEATTLLTRKATININTTRANKQLVSRITTNNSDGISLIAITLNKLIEHLSSSFLSSSSPPLLPSTYRSNCNPLLTTSISNQLHERTDAVSINGIKFQSSIDLSLIDNSKLSYHSQTLENLATKSILFNNHYNNNNNNKLLSTFRKIKLSILGSIQSFATKGTAASGSAASRRSLFPKRNTGKIATINETFSKRFFSTTTTSTTKIKMAPIEIDDSIEYDYDLIVIGGGSGGLAASKEAASLGKKVCMLDYVQPSPRGTTWGVGGTCVNVGCIPKKLMHHASLIGGEIDDAHYFGWQQQDGSPLKDNLKHDWSTLVKYVQNNIKGSNFSYRAILATQQVKYINAYGSFVEPHKVRLVYKNKKEEFLTSKHFIVATGERPVYPTDCEGAEQYAITSDDLFSLPHSPGRTLVVGASYVALECAGFLRGLGYDVTVLVRSIVLRGFDRQCSEQIRNYMENYEHVKFIDRCVMRKIEEINPSENGEPPLLRATYVNLDTDEEISDEFNTVMFAIGRKPCTDKIGLDVVGVELDDKGYVPATNEQTNVPHIFAIGDILQGKPQLTPVAIEAGVLLARRLYADQDVNCDYVNVPTTIFTPLEYGCCGYSEDEAIKLFGADNIEVYHQYFTPTEWKLNYYDRPRKPMNVCYAKVITTRSEDGDPTKEILLGFHFVGPNAGEVIQFTPFPLKMKATKADLDALIGIHPTCAEIFTMLPISKRSGKEATQQGCCG